MIDDAKVIERVKGAIWETFQMWHDGLAETVIAAHKAALAEAGYVIVPRDPTDDMLIAGHMAAELQFDLGQAYTKMWSAMIEAAPK